MKGVIEIPDSVGGMAVTRIADEAFKDCNAITSAVILESISEMGERAFYNCQAMTSIAIPSSIARISDFLLCNCYSLKNIIFRGTTEQWNTLEKGTAWNVGIDLFECLITCTDGTLSF